MKKVLAVIALAGVGFLGFRTGTHQTLAASQVSLQSTSQSASQISTGQSNTLTAVISGSDHDQNVLVDLELYDQNGNKIGQKFFDNELIPANNTKTYTMTTDANLASGFYHFSVGIFNSGWNGLIQWADSVQTFQVGSGGQNNQGNAAVIYDSNGSRLLLTPGNGTEQFDAIIRNTDSANSHSVLIDLEIYNSSNQKVGQVFFDNQNFDANVARPYTIDADRGLPAGQYSFAVGIFNPGWNGNLHWAAPVFPFTVGANNGNPGDNSAVVLNPSGTTTDSNNALHAQFTNNSSSTHQVLIDLELYNSSNQKVGQKFFDNQNFGANSSMTFDMSVPANLPAGNYRYAAGVFNPGWNGVLHWYDTVKTITLQSGTTGGGTQNGQLAAHLVTGTFDRVAFKIVVTDPDLNQIEHSKLKIQLLGNNGSVAAERTVDPGFVSSGDPITAADGPGGQFPGPGALFQWMVNGPQDAPPNGTFDIKTILLDSNGNTIQDFGTIGTDTFGSQTLPPPPPQPPVTAGQFTAQLSTPTGDRSFLQIDLSSQNTELLGKAALKVDIIGNSGNILTENILTGSPLSNNHRIYGWGVVPQPCDNNLPGPTGNATMQVNVTVIDQTTEATLQQMGNIGTTQTATGQEIPQGCITLQSSSVDQQSIALNQTATFSATLKNIITAPETAKIVIDLRDNTGKIIDEKIFDNQTFQPGDVKSYQYTTPVNLVPGSYHFSVKSFIFGDLNASFDNLNPFTVQQPL